MCSSISSETICYMRNSIDKSHATRHTERSEELRVFKAVAGATLSWLKLLGSFVTSQTTFNFSFHSITYNL